MFRVSSQTRDNVEWKTQADFRCRKGAALFVRSLLQISASLRGLNVFKNCQPGNIVAIPFDIGLIFDYPFLYLLFFVCGYFRIFTLFFCGPDGQEKLKTKRAAALPLALLSSGGVGLAVS